jgi:hypothetical protein
VRPGEAVEVARFTVKDGAYTFQNQLRSEIKSKTIWGLKTAKFHPVSLVTLSPNYWNEATVGNKHYFFFMDGLIPDGPARPFLNEFIQGDLLQANKRVFELLGSTVTLQGTPALGGLGFSSTSNKTFYCRVIDQVTNKKRLFNVSV